MNTLALFIDYFLYVLVALTVFLVGWKAIELHRRDPGLGSSENQLQERLEKLEQGLAVLSAIAMAAPFIGLMGTVMHIIEALRQLGTGSADMSLIGGPIATALKTTLVGLFSAVPAAIAGALFGRRIELLESRHRRSLQARSS